MTNTTNLAERLHFSKVDQTELEEVLQAFFGSATGKSPREIHYGRLDAKQPALIVKYSANSDIQSMDAGPTLTSDDLEHLERNIRGHLLERQSDRFSQAVFFAHVPVAGWYRCGDRFQIVPVPPDAPQPKINFMAGHPFLVEYRIPGSAEFRVNAIRQDNALREIELLLITLTSHLDGSDSNTVLNRTRGRATTGT